MSRQTEAGEVVAGSEPAHAVPRRLVRLERVHSPRAARLVLLPVREAVGERPAAVRTRQGPLAAAGIAVEAAVAPAVHSGGQVVAALGQQCPVRLRAPRRRTWMQ